MYTASSEDSEKWSTPIDSDLGMASAIAVEERVWTSSRRSSRSAKSRHERKEEVIGVTLLSGGEQTIIDLDRADLT